MSGRSWSACSARRGSSVGFDLSVVERPLVWEAGQRHAQPGGLDDLTLDIDPPGESGSPQRGDLPGAYGIGKGRAPAFARGIEGRAVVKHEQRLGSHGKGRVLESHRDRVEDG